MRRPRLVLDPDIAIGEALRQARERLGLTLEEISETTRVRARHLASIEAARLDQLPSRPFTVGYVRAYAKALGLDADATAARYRTEYPSPDDELRTPVGVKRQRRNGPLIAAVGVLAIAVVGWNVVRHGMARPAARPAAVAAPRPAGAPVANAAVTGPFAVEAPLPAPPEATAPAPYVTPVVGKDAANVAAPPPPPAEAAAAATPFVAQGAVYGPASGASGLIIQARKSISLEVRGPGGVVYFARQLAAGEAYRVPALPNLTAEVSNPANAELFEGGVSKGLFPQAQMPLKTVG
jgi:transcriptional regulator with XRE-family HTH domain